MKKLGGKALPGLGHGPFRLASLTDPWRFLLYSHDSWGLGHLKRNLALASALTARFPNANALVVTGSPCATQFDLPTNCDVLKLPSVSKDAEGSYISRSLSADVTRTIKLRSRLILESFRSFDPHLVLVDHQLTGLHGEALGMLHEARRTGRLTVYGMRDVLDEPSRVDREWDRHESFWALKHGYDRICVYGMPEVFDPRSQYSILRPFKHKVSFSGYVVAPLDATIRMPVPSMMPHVVVTMGGGQDGQENVKHYLQSLSLAPPSWTSHVVTGPLMDREAVREFKRAVQKMGMADRVRVSRFHNKLPHLLQAADAVVSMAGYNSCAEILQSRLPAVLLPRTHPRQEQLIRARRLQELGLATCLENVHPHALRAAVNTALAGSLRESSSLNLDGADRLCDLTAELLLSTSEPALGAARMAVSRGISKRC